jgi:hypothetical protein
MPNKKHRSPATASDDRSGWWGLPWNWGWPWYEWAVLGTFVVAAVWAYRLQIDIPEVDGKANGWGIFPGNRKQAMRLFAFGCLAWSILGPLALIGLQNRRKAQVLGEKTQQVEDQLSLIRGLLLPLQGFAAELAELGPTERKARRDVVVDALRSTLFGLLELLGGTGSGVRVQWYVLEGVAPNRVLKATTVQGAGHKSITLICEGDKGRGDDTFKALDKRESRIWHLGDPDNGWTPDKPVESYAAVPVASEAKLYGMIAMDSLDRTHIQPEQVRRAALVADAFTPIVAQYPEYKESLPEVRES